MTGSSTPNTAMTKDTTYETKAACKFRLLLEKLKQKSYKGLSDKEYVRKLSVWGTSQERDEVLNDNRSHQVRL